MRKPIPWPLLLLGACATNQRINIQDHGILLPTLRLERPADRTEEGAPAARSAAGWLNEIAYGQGNYAGGAAEYEVWAAQTASWFGTDPREPVFARAFAGLEFLHLSVDDPSLAGGSGDSGGALGPMVGLEVSWSFAADADVYVRGSAAGLLPDTTSSRGEAGLRARASAGVELFLGYRWWRVRRDDAFETGGLNDVNIDLHTDGIVFGLGLRF